MKELVKYMAQHLVDYPAAVSVKALSSGRTTIIELSVEKADVGKLIGREGRTADALRTIIYAASRKENKRAVLEIIDGRSGGRAPERRSAPEAFQPTRTSNSTPA